MTNLPIPPTLRSRAAHRLACLRVFSLIAFAAVAASAQDFSAAFSVDSGVAGGSMIQKAADSTNSIVNMIMGPGMYVVMALGAVLALYGYFVSKDKGQIITGVVGFVLAAVLRGIWGFW